MQIIQLLKNYRTFGELKPEQLNFIASKFHKREYLQGQMLIRKGEMADGLGIVANGRLNILRGNQTQTIGPLQYIARNDFYNDVALLSQTTSAITIVAHQPTLCYCLAPTEFFTIINQVPCINVFFHKIVQEKLLQIINNDEFLDNESYNIEILNYKTGAPLPSYIIKAMEYIYKNYANSITLDTLSHACGISKFYLSRLFKRHTGQTFVQYLNYRRINEAKHFMRYNGASVTEACYAVGFNDLSHFSRLFKHMEKKLPSQYLRAYLKTSSKLGEH